MKVQNPLIGRSSQKFANSVFSTWKGINVVRSKPLEVSNPQSPAQVTQRGKFAQMVQFARQALSTAKLGLKDLAIKKSEYNVFVGENIQYQKDDGSGIDSMDATSLVFAKGTLSPLSDLVTEQLAGQQTQITWSNANRPFSTPSDKVCVGILYVGAGGGIDTYREISRDTLASAEIIIFNDIVVPGKTKLFGMIFPYNDVAVGDSLQGNYI